MDGIDRVLEEVGSKVAGFLPVQGYGPAGLAMLGQLQVGSPLM